MIVNDLNNLDLGYAQQIQPAIRVFGLNFPVCFEDDPVWIVAVYGELPNSLSLSSMEL
jgi:hypothetical protein